MAESRGVYMLSPAHVDAVRRLATDPQFAAAIGIGASVSEADVARWVATQAQARTEGRAYMFVLSDRGAVLGVCGLAGVGEETPARLVVAVGMEHRRTGNAAFAANNVLELAFRNLQLDRVVSHASGSGAACHALLQRLGFHSRAQVGELTGDRSAARADAPVAGQGFYELTRQQWQDARARPALAALHPSLRSILEAELAAGNELAEMSTGWPDADSVFVRLRHPFRTKPAALPDDIEYHEPNDPHWWRADYSSTGPRHVLAS